MSHSTWRTSPCGQRRGECREYLPEYTKEGDLILPKNWRSWVYVGSPLTRDALNNGMAGFPEYHNVDIEPGSYEIYKKTGEFPEGTTRPGRSSIACWTTDPSARRRAG